MVEGKGAWGGARPTKGEEWTGGSGAVTVQLWLRISPAAAASAAAFAAASAVSAAAAAAFGSWNRKYMLFADYSIGKSAGYLPTLQLERARSGSSGDGGGDESKAA